MGTRLLGSFAALVLVPGGPAAPQAPPSGAAPEPKPPFELRVREVPLGQARDGIRWESLTPSPDGQRVAYATGKGSGLAGVALSAVFMGKSGTVRMVVDGQESREYVGLSLPTFSKDGRRVAYRAQSGTTLLDAFGKPLGGRQQFLVVDSVEGTPYEGVGPPVFSPDGRRIAHGAMLNKKVVIVLDGVAGTPHDGASMPVFSPDGSRIAYIAHDGESSHLVDGETVTPASHKATSVVRSPDGKRTAYLVEDQKAKKWKVSVDGVEGPAYLSASSPVFSADARRFAYLARPDKNQGLVVIDGVAGKPWSELGIPTFSPDGQRVAYAAGADKERLIVIEGPAGRTPPRYRKVGDPVFSPDGQHLAHLAHDGKRDLVVVDDVGGPVFDAVGTLAWSPDGRHLAYEARVAATWRLVVDGVVGPEYGRTTNDLAPHEARQHGYAWTWSGASDLWYVGRRGDAIIRWEVTVKRSWEAASIGGCSCPISDEGEPRRRDVARAAKAKDWLIPSR